MPTLHDFMIARFTSPFWNGDNMNPQEDSNTELNMKHFVKFKISELYNLLSDRMNHPLVKHKGKEKNIKQIVRRIDDYHITLNLNANRNYIMKGDDTLELDVLDPYIRLNTRIFWQILGTSRKFRCSDWVLGHYGIFIDGSTVYDSVRGRRHIEDLPSRIRLYDDEANAKRQAIIDVSKSNFLVDPDSNMTCGFELETQSTNDLSRHDLANEMKRKLATEHMESGPSILTRWMRADVESSGEWSEKAHLDDAGWASWLTSKSIQSYRDCVRLGYLSEQGVETIMEWISDDLEDEIDFDDCIEDFQSNLGLPSGIELVCDDSVAGFELRTVGPRTTDQFLSGLESVFEIPHQIDTRCSFHIHIKVNGIKHGFNRGQRQHMIRFLFENADRLPEGVLERWADSNANYFFLPDRGEDKMNFINFHQRLGTIEFRCFGNVKTVEDGARCLQLAKDAVVDYYSNESHLFIDAYEWGDRARETMETNDVNQLDRFAKAHMAQIEIAKENQVILDRVSIELKNIENNNQFSFVVGE